MLFASEFLDLPNRLPVEARPLWRSTESQFARETHHLIEGHAGSSDGAPTNLDAPAIFGREVAESLRGVKRVSAMADELGGFRSEFLAIKSSYHVLAAGCLLYTSDAADERSSV